MPNLDWNIFYRRAQDFSSDFEEAESERGEAQIFWIRFFEIFGIKIEKISARFESNESRDGGFIDFLWKSKILIEHKSRGKDLDAAFKQASDYFVGLEQRDLPTHICVCDFDKFRLTDLINNIEHEFQLRDLAENINLFAFLLGHKHIHVNEQEDVNLKAAKELGSLHKSLEQSNYIQADVFLVRLLFCFFAENSGIFKDNQFIDLIKRHSKADGSDLGAILTELFQVLNTDYSDRQDNRASYLLDFPFVNGELFNGNINIPAFSENDREQIIKLAELNWSKISTDIFGNMFQASLTQNDRHAYGAHYTSEEIIQRTIRSSFLDDLWDKFSRCRRGDSYKKLQNEISKLSILDPACGCGNFLIVSYIELRRLENEIIKKILGEDTQGFLDISTLLKVDINQFRGIEIDSFAVEIAKVSMWLTEHQMNIETGKSFGQSFIKLPLSSNNNIVTGDSLKIDWNELCDSKNSILIGNPPYLGKDKIPVQQKEQFKSLMQDIPRGGTLDYVSAWIIKAANFISEEATFSFVLTASVIQGEQSKPIWEYVFSNGCQIFSAHKSFNWKSNGPNAAGIHCVIICVSKKDQKNKLLYDGKLGDPVLGKHVNKISNYLSDCDNLFLESRNSPLNYLPKANFGCMPNDKGGLIFEKEEIDDLLNNYPDLKNFFKTYVSSESCIDGKHRFCLWTPNELPSQARSCPPIMERISVVRQHRENSTREATQALSITPYRFGEIRIEENKSFIFIPAHSSSNREIIPISYFDESNIPANSGIAIFTEKLWLLGLLQSKMHMEWVKTTCGRIRDDFRYSIKIVYNNFPVPDIPTDQINELSDASRDLINSRTNSNLSLKEIYDLNSGIPYEINNIHKKIDLIVDKIYRHKKDESRFNLLSMMHQRLSQ
tara:strand:+ start:657 stop:3329 length:2673 start_codon:yes stop_codon:yes gene_type:complete